MVIGILDALSRIAREKHLDRELLLEALEAGLLSAARKKYGARADIRVSLGDGQDESSIEVFVTKRVVPTVEDPEREIDIYEAREYDDDPEIGGEITIRVPLDEFGRTAIQAAKQIVIQRVREAEREQIFEEFHDKVGQIVTGDVQQVERSGVVVNLGRTEAILPAKEQIKREKYRQGDRVRAYVVAVDQTTKGPQIVLSRTHPDLLKKLFQQEVPEIYDGIVEIKAIAREPGARSKVAVSSNDDRVDPVGACVGVKGSRIQAIVRELSGEKIDIVAWSLDPVVFVSRALNPAKVTKIIVSDDEKSMRVIVPDDQQSLAIGKGGQNARLAAKLTDCKIDIIGESEHTEQVEQEIAERVEVSRLPGVGDKVAENLAAAGYHYIQDLEDLSSDELIKIPGIGPKTAERISIAVAAILEMIEEERSRVSEEEAEEAEDDESDEEIEIDEGANLFPETGSGDSEMLDSEEAEEDESGKSLFVEDSPEEDTEEDLEAGETIEESPAGENEKT
jgi:N utilization substance protein A